MPAAVKLQKEYGDDLQVIFVESQNSGYDKSIGMAAKYGWLGNQAIWTSDYLFSIDSKGLPSFALLDAEGKVVLKGMSSSLHSKMVETIESLVKQRNAAPEDVPSKVAKVYSELAKGNFAKAHTTAQKVLAKPGSKDTDAVVAAAEASLQATQSRLDGELARAQWFLENGYPLRAKEMVGKLVKGTKGNPEMAQKVTALQTELASEKYKADFSAAKSLAKLESALYENGGSDKLVKKLQDFVAKYGASPVAKRAEQLVEVARYAQL